MDPLSGTIVAPGFPLITFHEIERIHDSFSRQGFMRTIGAVLESVESGTLAISCAFGEGLTQQHGPVSRGVVASLVDVACGDAALSVMPDDREVLTVEFKIHFLKPAKADRVVAVGRVIQAGRTLAICEGSVFDATRTRVLARMTATMMAVPARSEGLVQVKTLEGQACYLLTDAV